MSVLFFLPSLDEDPMSTPLVLGFALLLRFILGLHSYSGAGTPPMYGDYEAQRHWMELTLHLPTSEWYTNSTNNNLQYWGLDYPPLTAYQSLIHGYIIRFFDPESMALNSSHGYESKYRVKWINENGLDEKSDFKAGFVSIFEIRVAILCQCVLPSKFLMRMSVIGSDLAIFFPSALLFVSVYHSKRRGFDKSLALAMILMQPPLLLIDHGHFQFNCISLGLTLAAVGLILSERNVLGSVFFCLSINHKQMSMYFAPAFFFHLLGKSFQHRNHISKLIQVSKLGIAVILTFVICWLPFLHSFQSISQVLKRLAPFERGLFEDHVANFWCSTSPLMKWKRRFPSPFLARIALLFTLISASPSLIHQLLYPSRKGFLYSLTNCAFSFYFFAYQVHEKSILLPLLPATMLFLEEPKLIALFVTMASFSMFHLLERDGLVVAYFALGFLFLLIFLPFAYPPQKNANYAHLAAGFFNWKDPHPSQMDTLMHIWMGVSFLGMVVLHLTSVMIDPPPHLPFLFPSLFCIFSFFQFFLIFVYLNVCQWGLTSPDIRSRKENNKVD